VVLCGIGVGVVTLMLEVPELVDGLRGESWSTQAIGVAAISLTLAAIVYGLYLLVLAGGNSAVGDEEGISITNHWRRILVSWTEVTSIEIEGDPSGRKGQLVVVSNRDGCSRHAILATRTRLRRRQLRSQREAFEDLRRRAKGAASGRS
jgi:hypothetical protein